ncbi:hypothetical protein A33Q_0591 [Indibacter alkaliphilus LW1]|uniref:Uncharacterized protein n=2 Tax=Indibacter TaxID=647744 RepID=S2EA49_INDAL|nr:hypothetical protein A33Q_0591 [Indibacter alkaliphilus LW1]
MNLTLSKKTIPDTLRISIQQQLELGFTGTKLYFLRAVFLLNLGISFVIQLISSSPKMTLLLRQLFGLSMALYFIGLGLVFPLTNQSIEFTGTETKQKISSISFWENFDGYSTVAGTDLTSVPSKKEYSSESHSIDAFTAYANCLATFIKCRLGIGSHVFVVFGIRELKFPSHSFGSMEFPLNRRVIFKVRNTYSD